MAQELMEGTSTQIFKMTITNIEKHYFITLLGTSFMLGFFFHLLFFQIRARKITVSDPYISLIVVLFSQELTSYDPSSFEISHPQISL